MCREEGWLLLHRGRDKSRRSVAREALPRGHGRGQQEVPKPEREPFNERKGLCPLWHCAVIAPPLKLFPILDSQFNGGPFLTSVRRVFRNSANLHCSL